MERPVNSPESMIATIRKYGVLPLFKSSIPGWSIEDMTAPGCWFDTEGVLGPWDWKVDAVRQGDIAYGKFIGGKAAFATLEWYRHLMNWRRSLPRYRMALGERYKASTNGDRQNKAFAPAILSAVEADGEIRASGLRAICSKKSVYESVSRFLQMGTWLVVGDIEREYRGPYLTYSGWQRTSLTTPERLFGLEEILRYAQDDIASSADDIAAPADDIAAPAWARMFEKETGAEAARLCCLPEESRHVIIGHIREVFPEAGYDKLIKLI